MRKRESFNEAADLYNEVRPTYPNNLIDWIIEKTQLTTTDALLEIAPGTGQCTQKFVQRHFIVHAVELGDKLAKLLLKNMLGYNVTVDISAFETWQAPRNKVYKLIYCATAWHWIEPEIKYQKTFDLLEDDGRLAIIWNEALGLKGNNNMDEAYNILFSYHKETPHSTKPKSIEESDSQLKNTKAMLEASGHFILDDYYETTWSMFQPKETFIKGFYTQSSYLSLCNKDKQELTKKLSVIFSTLDNDVETVFRSVVYLLKKVK